MRYFLFLFLIFFCSCQFFNKERFDTNTILEKELKVFKWDKLDQYPSFETCDEKINFEQNKNCFESVITNHIIKFFFQSGYARSDTTAKTSLVVQSQSV